MPYDFKTDRERLERLLDERNWMRGIGQAQVIPFPASLKPKADDAHKYTALQEDK